MFNVIFYEDEIGDSVPKKSDVFELSTLENGSELFCENTSLTKLYNDMPALTNGYRMFYNCSSLEIFGGDIPSVIDGTQMFYGCTSLKSFTPTLDSVTKGEAMFYGCSKLTSFTTNLSSVTGGREMFSGCSGLTTFKSDLSSLINGNRMFASCFKLNSIISNFDSLADGMYMFYDCTNLTSFKQDIKSITTGNFMFYGCSNLKSFTSDLSSLENGSDMFSSCINLVTFTSDLSSLTNGARMFYKCKLDAPSVMYILETLPQRTSNTSITIGIGVSQSTVNGKTTSQQLLDFAKDVGYNSWNNLKQAFIDKKWSVTWQFGGTAFDITLSEDEQFRGIPVYARLIEEENPEMAEYCTEDGTKYYNIDWGHDVTHPEDFEYFGSLLEACGYYGVIPKIYLEEV